MTRIVLKFGGPAIASTDYIQEVANKAIAEKKRGLDVVVVTAARAYIQRVSKDGTRYIGQCFKA